MDKLEVLEYMVQSYPEEISCIKDQYEAICKVFKDLSKKIPEDISTNCKMKDYRTSHMLTNTLELIDQMQQELENYIKSGIFSMRLMEARQLVIDEVEQYPVGGLGLDADFTGTKPTVFYLSGKRFEVTSWRELLKAVSEYFIDQDAEKFKKIIRQDMKELKKHISVSQDMNHKEYIYIVSGIKANKVRDLLIMLLNGYEIKLEEFSIGVR